jgi:YNFM family putative membrane transporter
VTATVTAGPSRSTFGGMAGFLIGATAMFAAMYETQAILPTIGRSFRVSPSVSGLTISMTIVMVAVGGWVWGPVSDRIGRRRSLVTSSALLVLPTVGVALAPNFAAFLGFRMLQGLCMPGLLIVGVPYVIETYAPRYGARVMGYYVTALVIGGLIGRVGVAELAGPLGWRAALGVVAVLPFVATLVLRRTLAPERERPRRSHHGGFATVGRLLRNRTLVSATLTGCGTTFAFTSISTYIAYRLERSPFALSATVTGLIFLVWLLGLLGPVAGRITERIGWRRGAAVALTLAGGGILVGLPDILPTAILGLCLAMISGFFGATAAGLGQGTSTDTDKGVASAIYFTAYYLAGSTAGYLAGLGWEAWRWGGVSVVAGVAVAVGAAAVVLGALADRRAVHAL